MVSERSLRPATVCHYRHYLRSFATYLIRVGLSQLGELSPTVLSASSPKGPQPVGPARRSEAPVVCCASSCAMCTAKVFCQAGA
ncbi:MAG: hypothetical protein AB1445_11390 [Bacillota bacterium]